MECIAFLRGESVADDLREVTCQLATEVLVSSGKATAADARGILETHIASGRAMARFEQMVSAQGGDTNFDFTIAPASEVVSRSSGFVSAIDAEQIGLAIIDMGGGRRAKDDDLDHSTGVEMLVRIGDKVCAGQPLVRVFAHDASPVQERLLRAISVSDTPAAQTTLIPERIQVAT